MPVVSVEDVAFPAVRHSDQECYVRAGHGGRPIEEWPVHRFYLLARLGERDAAEAEFAEWYAEQFRRFGAIPKRQGGMYDGSLCRLVRRRHGEAKRTYTGDPDHLYAAILAEACRERAAERLALLDSIAARGYAPQQDQRILGIRRDGCIFLYEGHHRAAALKVLGFESVPNVHVFPSAWLLRIATASAKGGLRMLSILRLHSR